MAVIDRGDFGAATSANSLRIVHGGLRYLARGDFPRMRESIRERSALLRIAPGLVEPLPVLVPTYRTSLRQGKFAFRLALATNDVLSSGRNRGLESTRHLPRGRSISRSECLRLFPWFASKGLSGGALWYDARLRNPERLVFSFLCSASRRGAVVANYVRADQVLLQDGAAGGVVARDLIGGDTFRILAKSVVVAAGPWTSGLTACTLGKAEPDPGTGRALALNLVLGREITSVAVGVPARTAGKDEFAGMNRFLFMNPQQGTTLLGTWYAAAGVGAVTSTCERGANQLIEDMNAACPGLGLSRADLTHYQWGWLPLKAGRESGPPLGLADRPVIVDHGSAGGVRHLFSVEGVKYTTARAVAQRVVDEVVRDMGHSAAPCRTAVTRLDGAGIDQVPSGLLDDLLVRRAIKQEMAVKLGDIIRRSGSNELQPGQSRPVLEQVARVAAAELGWTVQQQQVQVDEVLRETQLPTAAMEAVG